jgi:hypothetical protein
MDAAGAGQGLEQRRLARSVFTDKECHRRRKDYVLWVLKDGHSERITILCRISGWMQGYFFQMHRYASFIAGIRFL